MTDTATHSLLYPESHDFLVMRNLYVSAAKHIPLKFEVLNDEFKVLYARNPIRHIESRVKSLDSITAKLRKKEFPVSIGSAMRNINDIEETLTYCDFPSEHWTRIRTNNVIERLNREIRRRTRVVGCFPDGNSALMLVCARLRHVAGTQWGNKIYMNMKHLETALEDASIAG